jgi:hypothetical protein
MGFGVVLPTKPHLPDSFHVVPVDDVGDTKQFDVVADMHRSIQIKIVLFVRQLKSERAAFDFHGWNDFFHSKIEVGFHHVFFGVNHARSDLSDVAFGISDIYIPKFNWDRIINIFGAAEFDAVQDNPGTVCRNKFLIRDASSFFCGLDGFPQLIALPAKYEQLKKSDEGQGSSQFYKPPIGFVFIFSLLAIGFGFLGSLLGWDNFYKGRRLFGTALICCGGLLGGLGFFAWWGLSL